MLFATRSARPAKAVKVPYRSRCRRRSKLQTQLEESAGVELLLLLLVVVVLLVMVVLIVVVLVQRIQIEMATKHRGCGSGRRGGTGRLEWQATVAAGTR